MNRNNNVFISVVIPVFNEGKYIEKCIQSLLEQDYPLNLMEWIFVDGNSVDNTVEILKKYKQEFPNLIVIETNPNRIVSYAMNIGIKLSRGKYIVRLDAHSEYKFDYISKCVYYLNNINADNVGGVAETKANGFVGSCIAKMLSSRFGVGNSGFRTNGNSGYVDTVPFGAFRREVFLKYGGYDERLVRNEDNELNYRIRKNGGKIYLANEIKFSYYCRDSIKGIVEMAMKNGMWNIIASKLCPGSMSIRHFIPMMFVLSIIFLLLCGILSPFFFRILLLELALYSCFATYFSGKQSTSIKEWLLLMFLFPTFHISYGMGSFKGIYKALAPEFRNKDYVVPHILKKNGYDNI